MPLVVVEHPPLFVFRRTGEARAEDFVDALERLRVFLEACPKRGVAVYYAGDDPNGSPDGHARRVCAAWMAENDALLRTKLISLEFASKSPLSRAVLTAIFWMRKPPFATYFHPSLRGAIANAIVRCDAPIETPELLVEVDAAMHRHA